MTKRCIPFCLLLLVAFSGRSQDIPLMADSVRIAFHIPELAWAVVSSDSIYEMQVSGYRKINSSLAARPEDKFRIGSNTKAI
ncbi:MAG TPA: hypothetical protein VLD19_05220, partial [Chitinophagaceae bacterium]|nr:hypothetical protein [Chitinophagaceae bacterium]